MVHGLFASTGDWDNYLKSFEDGWPQALAILRLYLPISAVSAPPSYGPPEVTTVQSSMPGRPSSKNSVPPGSVPAIAGNSPRAGMRASGHF